MSRLRMPGKLVRCACVGTWLMLLPQMVLAELRFTSPERAAGVHDYVRDHVVCEDGTCGESAEGDVWDDLPEDSCSSDDGRCAERWWVRADYLMGWVQGNRLPPLVTTGVLGRPGTTILFGDESVDDELRHGVRLTLGVWLDDSQTWGLEGHYAYLGDAGGGYQAAGSDQPMLARPFFNRNLGGTPDAQWVALPGMVTGQIGIDTSSDVNSTGLLLRRAWLQNGQGQVAIVGGYRYFRFRERLTIDQDLVFLDTISIQSRDEFAVQNDFHGAEIGLAAEMQRGRWSLDALTKLGVGSVRQRLDIGGRTQSSEFLGTQPSGLLAQTTNIGHSGDSEFAFLPELGVNVGYSVTSSLNLRAGYSLLWLTDALRTGDQIDLGIGGPIHPQASLDATSVCIQGINLGVEWRR